MAFPLPVYQKRGRTTECFKHHLLTWNLTSRANQGALFKQETPKSAIPVHTGSCPAAPDLKRWSSQFSSRHGWRPVFYTTSSWGKAWRAVSTWPGVKPNLSFHKHRPAFGIYQTWHCQKAAIKAPSKRCWALLQPHKGTSKCCEGQNFKHQIGQGTIYVF